MSTALYHRIVRIRKLLAEAEDEAGKLPAGQDRDWLFEKLQEIEVVTFDWAQDEEERGRLVDFTEQDRHAAASDRLANLNNEK